MEQNIIKQKVETIISAGYATAEYRIQELIDKYNSDGYILTSINSNDNFSKVFLIFTKEE